MELRFPLHVVSRGGPPGPTRLCTRLGPRLACGCYSSLQEPTGHSPVSLLSGSLLPKGPSVGRPGIVGLLKLGYPEGVELQGGPHPGEGGQWWGLPSWGV